MNAQQITVVPKKAMRWLETNKNNRPIREQVVKRYAEIMKDGKWALNGETIKFSESGELIDGQHRLHACVMSGVSFDTYVVMGLPEVAYDSIDQGQLRKLSDLLARKHEKHYCLLAGALRVAYQVKVLGEIKQKGMRSDHLTKFLDENPSFRDSVQFASEFKDGSIITGSIVGGLHFLMSEMSKDACDKFWKMVLIGENLSRKMPEYLLRSRLIENSSSKIAKLNQVTTVALCIKAWNLSRLEKTTGQLMFKPGLETFPKPI